MLNVSVVNLGSLSQDAQLVERATELFSKIMKIEQVSVLGRKEITQLKRTSEQLAISITLQERGSYKFLKEKDGVMDGGLAESFYLGATQGF
jgi:ribosomal protein L5